MNILVTGAAGFIGSHVSEHLVKQGHQVTGVDNFDLFTPRHYKELYLQELRNTQSFRLYEADIRDSLLLDKIFGEQQVDAVIHLAAKAGVRPSIEAITEYYDVNVNGTLNLLEAMRKQGVKKMLFASSSSVYGNNRKVPFSESDPVDHPISPYASTKKSGELLCHVYSHLHGMDITCLRFFTVYGPRQRPDLAIHKFARLLFAGKPLPFYGDGSSSRDYTFIDDIVNGVDCALTNLGGFRLYNLGESRVIRLKDLIGVLEDKTGRKARLNLLPPQPGDVEKTFADISKARNEIGYNPKVDLETGIERFVNWYSEHLATLMV